MTDYWGYGRWSKDRSVVVEFEANDDMGCYEWSVASLVSKETESGKLYAAYTDSGCSCNCAYDEDPDNLAWGYSPDPAMRAVKEHIRNSSMFSAARKAESLSDLNRWRQKNYRG